MPIISLPISDRTQRRIARMVSGKKLPEYVYRWDEREPAVIAQVGFQPNSERYPGDHVYLRKVSLFDHVRNSWSDSHMSPLNSEETVVPPKSVSQWVSTGSYGMLNPLDGVFVNKARHSYLYKIRSSLAISQNGRVEFFDVNDEFDRAKKNRPYASQREWIKIGGIQAAAIVSYMHGATFYDMYVRGEIPEDERRLGHWMPL